MVSPHTSPPVAGVTTIPGLDGVRSIAGLEIGARVGRYVVVSVLGSGGMGIVYGAFDPDLDRKVALKLLHRSASSTARKETAPRLLREAQAAARVRHPNVITVHDVGQCNDDVFVAMEFVEGETLRQWMDRPHDWREIVSVMRSAGEGLRAAHAEGLVHRDFKPDNVMIASDGRVVVMDFGLARAPHSQSGPPVAAEASLVDAALTRTGAVLGTPAYMAPEQHMGREPDARVDQFSFCVTLYEALYGERPFDGEDLPSLTLNVTSGKVRTLPPSTNVPRWLRPVILVGLATAPADRYADMGALLAALSRDPTRRRRWLGAVAGVALLGLGVVGVDAYRDRRREAACDRRAQAVYAVWSDERKTALRDGFEATDVIAGKDAWEHTEPVLDEYATMWAETSAELCRTADDGDPTGRACLDARLRSLRKLLTGLDTLEPATMHMTVRAASSLDDPTTCADPRDDDLGGDALRIAIVDAAEEARVSRTLGRYDESLVAAERAVTLANQLDDAGLLARALAARGHSHESTGQLRESEEDLERAHFLARENADDHVAATTATKLAVVVGERLGRYDEGLRWGRHARALLQHDRQAPEWASLMLALSSVQMAKGDYADAVESAQEGLAIYRERHGARNTSTASALNDLGIALALADEHRIAIATLREALDLRELAFGPRHPTVAETHENLANALIEVEESKAALHHYRRALEIKRATIGEHHLGYARTAYNLGALLGEFDRGEEGLALLRQALEIRTASLPAEHGDIALTHLTIGATLYDEGDYAESIVELERAKGMLERAFGPEHPYVALALGDLGQAQLHLGDREQARELLGRARTMLRATTDPDDHHLEEIEKAYAELD